MAAGKEKVAMLMEESFGRVRYKYGASWITKERLAVFLLIFLGIVLVITGISLLALSNSKAPNCGHVDREPRARTATTSPSREQTSNWGLCEYSHEAQRIGLAEFMGKVKSTYYKHHPFNIVYDPDVFYENLEFAVVERVKAEYVAYDPTPSVIKSRTDASLALLEEFNNIDFNLNALKPRERKSVAQIRHYLQHMFGQPYDMNYYTGDWMMGPNLFCWQPVCYHGFDVYNGIGLYHKPYDVSDLKLLKEKLETHKAGILQYIENMKMGIRKGMVRSVEECLAGTDSIKRKYLNVSLYNETGIWKEWFVEPILDPEYYSNITKKVDDAWKKKHGMNVSDTVKDYLLTYLGKPLHQLLRFLEEEYIRYCVPSNLSSGLGRLPLKYVWYDGKENKSFPTEPVLPSGDKLDGRYAYSLIMSYFTTNDMTPMKVHDLGKKQLDMLYPKVLEIAKEVTGINDEVEAVRVFRQKLNSSESFFNDAPIPKNESGKEAHRKCSNLKGAERYCPKRWAALQLWFREARRVMSMLDPKTVNMFYFTGPKHTTPNCPIDLKPDLNPSSGAQSYEGSDMRCSRNAVYNIPFFLENLGPKFSEWSVNAHESRPGHHTQVQGSIEHFHDGCHDALTWLDEETHYTAFTEGWALYSENPLIAQDTDTYKNEPMQRFGMLKWQIWRAIRLIVDTGLHYYTNFTRDDALWYFDKYAWDNTDLAEKEVTRYQSDPGQATAYMIGQIDIVNARKYAEDKLKDKFSLRDFHYQVLAQGSSPLAYLKDHVERYVDCLLDGTKEGCDVILMPPKQTEYKRSFKANRWPKIRKPHRHYT